MNEYKKLGNQPLRFVLAEFRFSSIMQIVNYIPEIHEALRKQYPTSTPGSDQIIQMKPSGIAVSTVDRWAFISANKRNAIDINQDRIVCITTDYERFGGFSETCKQVIETLVSIVDPTLILRVGLRYSDLLLVDDNENIADLVNDHFGLPTHPASLGETQQHNTDTFLHTDTGTLTIRTLYGKNNLSCLPDVQGLPIPISADTTPSERMILDFDHCWEAKDESINFTTNSVLETLAALHQASREAFWKVTTENARNTTWA